MKTNNYDMSSIGTSIEVSAYYDTNLDRLWFEESFEKLGDNWFYTDYGNVSSDVSFSIGGLKPDLKRILEDQYDFVENMNKQELLDTLDNFMSERYGHASLETFEEWEEELKDYNLELIPSTPIEKIVTRGYSQGDYAEVFYFPDKLAEVWGREVIEGDLKTEIDHLFWDCPIYCAVEIDSEEFNYEGNPYEFERSEFIDAICKWTKPELREQLETLIPNEINYE